jgi:erythromycin esterase
MKRKIAVIFLLFTMIFTSIGAYAESNLTRELKENLIPLRTTEAENGFDDLIPFKEILKDKKIVAMGEATHGTAEFFQMKHRMFEFLVEEMGYRIFGIEAEFGGSQVVNDYILHGEGSVEDCLNAMIFWTWDTKEVAEMIEWMREFNEKAEADDKIKFYGFDMQGIDYSLKYVLNYLEKLNPNEADKYGALGTINFNAPDMGNVNILNNHIDNIQSEIIKNRNEYIENSSVEEYDLIERHIEIIYQWIDFIKHVEFNKRDYYMAENVKWILNYEDKYYGNDKIMLWAHNGHVSNGLPQYINLGENLKNFFNEDYYAIGFDFYKGNFVSRPYSFYFGGLANFHIESTPEGSLAHEMMKTEIPISFLDIENAGKNKILSDFLGTRIHINFIGALYSGKHININSDSQMVLKDTFDGIIFIESTTEAQRSRPGRNLPNGNNALVISSILSVAIIVGIIILLVRFYKRRGLKLEQNNQRGFYVLKKDKEGKANLNIIERFIVRTNNSINSISKFKYMFFVILILTIISILLSLTDYHSIYQSIYDMQGIFTILNLAIFTIIEIVKVFIVYIFGLNVIKSLLRTEDTYISHILIVAIIGALINTFGYRHSGILLYSYKIILNIFKGFVLCYSYSIFNYRWSKPLINISIILSIHNILMVIFSIFVYSF